MSHLCETLLCTTGINERPPLQFESTRRNRVKQSGGRIRGRLWEPPVRTAGNRIAAETPGNNWGVGARGTVELLHQKAALAVSALSAGPEEYRHNRNSASVKIDNLHFFLSFS
ncbi:hypothetical protein EOD39_0498 [Acipenser ruthenus]|uniref:Uncharacterized protein n=1 Tax=Acipenser ruthenus TaxID=7906 RepID=A0A444U354_ACIRT|nr:hypothetical protein EOD39_0498 [Acipenser ruthenus]